MRASFTKFWKSLFSQKRPSVQHRSNFRPLVELLEDRATPADLGMPILMAPATGWPTFHHDTLRTGQTSAPVILHPVIEWANQGQELLGARGSAAVPVGLLAGAAYVPTDFGTVQVGKHTGLPATSIGGGGAIGDYYSVLASPSVDSDGVVYSSTNQWRVEAMTEAGVVWVFDPAEPNQSVTTDILVPQETPQLTFPDVFDGFVGTRDLMQPFFTGHVRAIADGVQLWKSPDLNGEVLSLSFAYDATVGGYVIYARTANGIDQSFLYQINALNGAVNWGINTGSPPKLSSGYVTIDPLAPQIYFANDHGWVTAADNFGTTLWATQLFGGVRGAMTLDAAAGILYVPHSTGIYALSSANGAQIWYFDAPEGNVDDSPALAGTGDGSMLYFGTSLGQLTAVHGGAGALGGTMAWSLDINWVNESSPAIDSLGHVLVGRDTFGAIEIKEDFAPVGTDVDIPHDEDEPVVLAAANFGFTDPYGQANNFSAVKITTLPGVGVLTLDGVPVVAGDFVSIEDINAGKLVYTPPSNASGGNASFTFQVQDDGEEEDNNLDRTPRTMTFNLVPVNDAPVNSVPGAQQINEGNSRVFSAANGNAITVADVDAGINPLQVTLTVGHGNLTLGGTTGLTFSAGDGSDDATMTFTGTAAAINSALSALTYTPDNDYSGADALSILTEDLGNTGSGGNLSDSDSVDINVVSINDAPVGTDNDITVVKNMAYTFSEAVFGFSDPNDASANSLHAVIITSLPLAGILLFNGNAVAVNQVILAADIGLLTYVPPAETTGIDVASFTFKVQDDGGTESGGIDTDLVDRTITIDILGVAHDC